MQAHDDEILTSVKSEDVYSGKKAIRKGVEGAAHMGKNIGKILASVNSQDASSELNPKRNGVEGDVNVETNIDQIFTSVKSEDLNSEISAVTGVEEDVNVGADDNEILNSNIEDIERVKEEGKFLFNQISQFGSCRNSSHAI